MTEPGERPSGVTKEQVDRKVAEIKDPVERRRLQTIANITDPLIRHKESLGLNDKQLADLRKTAIKAGQLEAARLKEFLGKGMVHRLDALFEEVVQEDPEYLNSLSRASFSIRSVIEAMRVRAEKMAEDYDDFDTAEDYLRNNFGGEASYPLPLSLRIEGNTSLTTTILQRLGVLKEGQSVVTLRKGEEWRGEHYSQVGNICGLPASFDKDVAVDVYQRNGRNEWNSWDIYLKISGDAGLEMMTTPVQESPLLQEAK